MIQFFHANKVPYPHNRRRCGSRFDLAVEAHIVTFMTGGEMETQRVVLPQAYAEKLCHLILTESITCLICGTIEEEYFQFLSWKKIAVIDAAAGPW